MIYAIGDLHLDSTDKKPMSVFGGNWENHDKKIFDYWQKNVCDEDLVLLPGDISWAMKFEEAIEDLKNIDCLKGLKIISKGNHDYWWSGINKMNKFGFKSIYFIQNNSLSYQDYSICAARGWISKDSDKFDSEDLKIYERELGRLRLSLESAKKTDEIITMLHYPPFNMDKTPNDFHSLMKEYNVKICIYGHLHAEGHIYKKEGLIDGIDYHLVSSDYLNFKLKLIKRCINGNNCM